MARVRWAPCPDKNAQREEERGELKGTNGTAEPGVEWHWLGWTVQLRQAVVLESERAIIVPFPWQDHLQRKESGKCCNNQSAHWQLAVQFQSMERQQPRKPPLRNMQQQVTSSLWEVETDSQSDAVDRVVVSSSSSLNDESSPHSDFIPEPCQETLPPSKYGRKRARFERDGCVSWEKITFWYNFSTLVKPLDWSWLVALLVHASFSFPKTLYVC